ncbi:DUF1214 domain-containing protein [Williamsia sp. SKLECPSW1]
MTVLTDERLEHLARDLQIWGFPCVFAQRLRLRFTLPLTPDAPRPASSAGAPLDRMGHQRRLSDPQLTSGVAPNVDTLYSLAFLDLDGGEFRLHLPDLGDRYYGVQIGEADSTTACAVGRRTHGGRLPEIVIRRRGTTSSASTDRIDVTCRSRFVMVAIRILVDPADDDVSVVRGLQQRIRLRAPAVDRPDGVDDDTRELIRRDRDRELRTAHGFVHSLGHAVEGLGVDDVPPEMSAGIATLQDVVRTGHPRTVEAVEFGLARGLDEIATHVRSVGRVVNGWSVNDRGPEFGDDLLLRASVAYSQIYVNPVEEAVYPVCESDSAGRPLDGQHEYTVTFRAGQHPPARFFWSLTMYHRAGLLVENPIGRYAISDRTPGLRTDADGSITIRIRVAEPASGVQNWLPCPPGGFRLMLRLYGPTTSGWDPPGVERA